MTKFTEKTKVQVGDHCYLRQFSNDYWINMVKTPYTVIAVNSKTITVREAHCIFPLFKYNPEKMDPYYAQFDGQRPCFYDTVAESFEDDIFGKTLTLTWHPKRGLWGTPGPENSYPLYAIMGKWEHQPYLN